MAELKPEDLEKLADALQRLTKQSYTVSDVMENELVKRTRATSRKAQADALREARRQGLSNEKARLAQRQVQAQFNAQNLQTINSLKQLGSAVTTLTARIYKGEQGARVFSDAIGSSAEAIGTLTFLLGGPLVKALTLVTGGLIKFGQAAADQSDRLFDSFQSLQRSGGNAADGLRGVFDLMQDFSLGIENLGELNELIAGNASALAIFQGNVFDGARAMGAVGREIKTSGLRGEFMRMGLSISEINENIGGYIALQSRLTGTQERDTRRITKSVADYVKETDAITRLTGMNRREQEAAQNEALAIEQFRIRIMEEEAKGTAEGRAEADRLRQTYKLLAASNREAAVAFAQLTTGFVTDGPGLGATILAGGDAMRIATDRNLSAAETAEQFGQSLRRGAQVFVDGVGRVGKFNEVVGLSLPGIMDTGIATKNLAQRMEGVTDEQERMRIAAETGVNAQVNLREAQLNTRDNLQSFVNIGVNPATIALQKLASAAESLTDLLPGKRGTYTAGGAAAGATTGAVIGSIIPGLGTALGAGVGGLLGGIFGFSQGGPEAPAAPAATTRMGYEGLRLKSQEAIAGGEAHPRLVELAHSIQTQLGGNLRYFSAFRDRYHMDKASAHNRGTALDFTLADPRTSAQVAEMIRRMPGVAKVIDEYTNPSANSTGGHIHAEIQAAAGAILTGPSSGYRPNLTMHGTEAVVPMTDGKAIPVDMAPLQDGLQRQVDMMSTQISRLDDMIGIMRQQFNVSNKILQASQN